MITEVLAKIELLYEVAKAEHHAADLPWMRVYEPFKLHFHSSCSISGIYSAEPSSLGLFPFVDCTLPS